MQLGCESIPLYEGDRDPFARMIEVIEPIDISPTDRSRVPSLAGSKIPAVPAALPATPLPTPQQPTPPTLQLTPTVPAPAAAIPEAPKAPAVPSPPQIAPPASPPKMAPPASPPQMAPPASPSQPSKQPQVRAQLPPPMLPSADRLAIATHSGPRPTLNLDDAQAAAPKSPNKKLITDPKRGEARTLAVKAPAQAPKEKLPSVPAPPSAPTERAANIPPPPIPAPNETNSMNESSPQAKDSQLALDDGLPTARDRGRPLIKRSNKVAQSAQQRAGFASLDGASSSELGAQIGGMARPVGVRTPQITRHVVSSAKGMLAECYVNEQLFQDDAKGTAIVVIEIPKELPNRPRIETSDFSDTMNACLLDAVRNLPFPGDPEGAVYRLRIPFRFRPD